MPAVVVGRTPAGQSAYQVAVANGFVGTQLEWLLSLEGPQGPPGNDGADGAPGAPGAPGNIGPVGPAGPGLVVGGVAGDAPVKQSAADYDTAWRPVVIVDTTQTITGPKTFAAQLAVDVPVTVKAAAAQTGDLTTWADSSGATLAKVVGGGQGVFYAGLNVGSFLGGARLAVDTATASSVGVRVRGATSQTGNLQEWQDVAGVIRARVSSVGAIVATNNNSPNILANPTSAAAIGLTVKAAVSQSANLVELQDSAGAAQTLVSSGGAIRSAQSASFGTTSFLGGAMSIAAQTATQVGAVIRGAASQTANLAEFQDSTGAIKSRVASDGGILGSYAFLTAGSTGTIPLTLKGAASQLSDLLQFADSAGAFLAGYAASGKQAFALGAVGTPGMFPNGDSNTGIFSLGGDQLSIATGGGERIRFANTLQVYVPIQAATNVGLTVRGAASQSANLIEAQDSAGTVIARVTSGGGIVSSSLLQSSRAGAILQGTNAGAFQVTVGAAGGAAALPATPTKYMKVRDEAGTDFVVPMYAAA